jgi:hypothetical protein
MTIEHQEELETDRGLMQNIGPPKKTSNENPFTEVRIS